MPQQAITAASANDVAAGVAAASGRSAIPATGTVAGHDADAIAAAAAGRAVADATRGRPAAYEQIETSPYAGRPDLSALSRRRDSERIDPVSVADLLRNSFVYPPHSILEDVKLVTPGFDADTDMGAAPSFRFQFRERERSRESSSSDTDWVGTYHRLLCEAVTESCAGMRSPWLLQSGGKDSTTLAIAAADARPDTVCITYLGGREENELASASAIARTLGLRHESLVCDPGRAYDRYVSIAGRMPLLTADFAMLSYVDLATEIAANGGDGVMDGLGSDWYFGMALHRQQRILTALSRGLRLPARWSELPLLDRSFPACFVLSSLEMSRVERLFPGSRFSDTEVDELFGRDMAHLSRARLATFEAELATAESSSEWRAMVASIAGGAAAFAKGLYTLDAMSLRAAYPFCNNRLREWVHREVPRDLLVDPTTRNTKVLVRQHIATRFADLPYVARKGSFRFDLRGLAKARFDQVHAFAEQARPLLPGATRWLERNRRRLDNKFHASKFYLLAVVLPWITARGNMHANIDQADSRTMPADAAATFAPPAETPRPVRHRLQITMSPYYGRPDFSALRHDGKRALDRVSFADLLRNGFVYPPHSVYEDVKIVTFGFSPLQDMHERPEFRFRFRDINKSRKSSGSPADWLDQYHRLLCAAYARSCSDIRWPWLLQSGGKDSTPLAIAASEVRPETTCITYLGGREEDEVASASFVARKLGLRHETLVCDPARAYDRYVALVPRMPMLTADFALLSYVDLVTEIVGSDGDGVVDGMGSDSYFGITVDRTHRMLTSLARDWKLPDFLLRLPLVERNFALCYALSTLQMSPIERAFPGSRFSDREVDELFGRDISSRSRQRLELFQDELASACTVDEWFAIAMSVAGSAGGFAKGLYSSSALNIRTAYPFCDSDLRDWVYREVPRELLVDPITRANKVLVRNHIATRFDQLPYVSRKGSFRFDLCGLAQQRFDQVHASARRSRDMLPGAVGWLERNRGRLDNKYHASKFYLLAVVLPWLEHHGGA